MELVVFIKKPLKYSYWNLYYYERPNRDEKSRFYIRPYRQEKKLYNHQSWKEPETMRARFLLEFIEELEKGEKSG